MTYADMVNYIEGSIDVIIQVTRFPDGRRGLTEIAEVLPLADDGHYRLQDMFTYQIGKRNRPVDQPTAQFVRRQLDALQLGSDLSAIHWGTKKKPIPLPPSTLLQKKMSDVPNP